MTPRRHALALRATIAAAAAATVLVVPAPASAQSSLSLRQEGAAVQNQLTTIVASGSNAEPTSESNLSGMYLLSIYAKFASVDPTCAPDKSQESTNYFNNVFNPALAENYAAPAIGLLETYGPGSWNMQLKQAFSKPGRWLLCGYSEHFGATVATAQLTVNVASAGGSTRPGAGVRPAVSKKPRVTLRGRRLSCARGKWANAAAYRYAWIVDGKTKRGARRRAIAVTRSLRGSRVACRVTAYNEYGKRTATSRAYRVR